MRASFLVFAAAALPALALLPERDARACGGYFGPPTETDDVVSDHRMVLSVSPQQTTLYDEIAYSGSPASFAWVLPISGQVTIGVSANAIFDTFDSLTATVVSPPNVSCPAPPQGCATLVEDPGTAGGSSSGGGHGVNVTSEQVVGPYQTVQLQSTDPAALDSWLTTNGYAITDAVKPIIAAYVAQGFDFLAMKLVPGQGVGAMRPVRVSFNGASPTLPLRMVAAGTGSSVGITLFIAGDGRWEPSNFPWFHIDDSELVWDYATSTSNYTALEQQKEAAAGNATWEVEASISEDVAGTQSNIEQTAEYGLSINNSGSGGGPTDPGADGYLAVPASDTTPGQTSDAVMQADLGALFTGISGQSFRLTRLRSDLAHGALVNDLQLQASADQSELTNVRVAAGRVNGPMCPVYNGCTIVGSAPLGESTGAGSAAGCSTSAAMATDWRATAGLAGVLGLVTLGAARARRNRRKR
jgi:hypothetical protein